jgi:UDP:flavonoid glycosyltransferase YjiC (YdhE family)
VRLRVLFTTTGHSGHLLPLAPLARACERAGHHVAVAAHVSRVASVERLDLPTLPIREDAQASLGPLVARLAALPLHEADTLAIREGFGRIGAGSALGGALDVVDAWRPDVVVHESYELAGPIAAERRGIPSVRVALGLASTEAWMAALAAPAIADLRRELGLAGDPDGRRPAAVLSLIPPGLDDGRAHRFRDLDAPSVEPLPAWWANAADPLVYVTLGSVAGSLPFFPALYRSLLDALAALPVRVLVTLGRDADARRLGPVPSNGHVEAWVEQERVLSEAAVVIGHGGHGTTLGALAHGVPLALLPLFAGDQWRTARRVAEIGAGIVLEDGERRTFDPPGEHVIARLPNAVRRLLDDATFRRAAERIAGEIAALPPADAMVAVLEDVR